MVTRDTFSKKTPLGRVKFTNIIGSYVPTKTVCQLNEARNVTAQPRIVLACHYDSIKLNDRGEHIFTGAIDAGVSCASILYLAKSVTPHLEKAENFVDDSEAPTRPTLQLVFFDGEEPLAQGRTEFKAKDDSLYGSRHLVKMWSQNSAPQTEWFQPSVTKKPNKRERLMNKSMLNTIQQLSEKCLADDVNDNEMDNDEEEEGKGQQDSKKSGQMSAEEDNVIDNEVDDNVEIIMLEQEEREKVQGTLRKEKIGAQVRERQVEVTRQLYRLCNTLDSIELLILLDLIGGKNPKFYNTTNQGRIFFRLSKIGNEVKIWSLIY